VQRAPQAGDQLGDFTSAFVWLTRWWLCWFVLGSFSIQVEVAGDSRSVAPIGLVTRAGGPSRSRCRRRVGGVAGLVVAMGTLFSAAGSSARTRSWLERRPRAPATVI
jgi:hypothetical protein